MKWVAQPWQLAKAPPHTIYRCLLKRVKVALPSTQKQTQGGCQIEETKKYGPYERTEQNPRKELNKTEITNLSYAEFKTLVIKMLTEIVEYCCKIKGKVKAMQNEMKENIQGTNSDGKEIRTQINNLDQKEEINIQPEQNEESRIQKTAKGLGTSGATLDIENPNHRTSKGEEEEQESETSKAII